MSETTIGTDAISCSLALGRPTSIAFSEHYIEVGHEWAGSAAPLHHPLTNEILGCLSIYGHGDFAHPNALDFVTAAGKLVEGELHNLETRAQFILLQNYERHRIRFPNDDLICVSRDGIACAGSSSVFKLLGLPEVVPGNLNSFVRVLDIPGTRFPKNSQPRQVQLLSKGGSNLKAELLPVVDADELVGFVGILVGGKVAARRQAGTSTWSAIHTFDDIVHGDGPLAARIAEAKSVAREGFPILLTGESGTGKELFAHAIHNESARRAGPFVAINCGGLNDELLSAELFGYADGAFTGASKGGKAGKMELANGGSLFLDEAEAMSPRMQVHLLRAIEEARITPIGADKPRPIDVRIIAATNVDLESKVKQGTFRRDLYYRLSVFTITIPALRERPEEVSALVDYFLAQMGGGEITSDARQRLRAYCWPGNVRQLRNVLQQARIRSTQGAITASDLPESLCLIPCHSTDCGFPSTEHAVPLEAAHPTSLRDSERETIVRVLRECSGNISRAANKLGVHRVTLHRKIESLGIRIDRIFV